MMSGLTRLHRSDRSSSVAAEGAAQANAARQRSGQDVQSSDSRFSPARGEAPANKPGEPIGRGLRAEMESRFGRDFSNVRVHTNSEEAGAMGARAFARGNDIAFAPGESPKKDRALLAHELTHTVQQAEAGDARVQMDPKGGQGGIGNAPPSEPFATSDKSGPEDDAVLFDLNQATLSGAAIAVLKRMAAGQQGAVVIAVHGYSSGEGEAEYNVNLSAHRAAAVKAELLRLLPKDSVVNLVAHGETSDFGPAAKNRRAGIKLLPRPTAPEQKAPDDQRTPDPAGDAPKRDAKVDPGVSGVNLFPKLTLNPAPLVTFPPAYVPQLSYNPPIDWLVMRNKWASYGLVLDARTGGDIEAYARYQRNASIGFFTAIGLHPFDAAKAADALLPIAIGVGTSAYLSNGFPNHVDLMDRELKGTYPDSWKTPQVPITDIIDFLYQKKTGKDNDYLFRF